MSHVTPHGLQAEWRVRALEQEVAVCRKALACSKASLAARRREHAEAAKKVAMLQG